MRRRRLIGAVVLAAVGAGLGRPAGAADDWGAYAIVPASAPTLLLEAAGPDLQAGVGVTVGRPDGSGRQRWLVAPVGNDRCAIRPAGNPDLALTVAGAGTADGTPVRLEADARRPEQAWTMRRNDDGSYCLVPGHAPGRGLDHFGGDPRPGARVDLWANAPGDSHLRWWVRPLAGSPPPATPPGALSPADEIPEVDPAAVPRGEVRTFRFDGSRVFPGTVRDVAVFIPKQYDGTRPACVYVKTDGYNATEKPLLEGLIAAGAMPVTVGVFFRPGELPAPMPGTIPRRNRGLEYDGLGDDLARFLLDELLPEVARRFDLKLSDRGDDRAIAGGSSGGIAAFNAAWSRPDAFRRVYANSGSFVAFRGGHEFPTLVRKTEAKPIRAYLTTGTRDMENAAGDWTLVDQEMDKALKFAGYDYRFRVVDGGHVAGYYDHFRAAMAFLWRGWPGPVVAGPGGPRVRDLLIPGEDWHLVAGGRPGAHAAAGHPDGSVLFVESGSEAIHRIGPDGSIGVFAPDAGPSDGLAVGPGGEVIAVSRRTGRVTRFDPAGRGSTVVDGLPGRSVVAMPNGDLYVTARGDGPGGSGEVWLVRAGAKTRVDAGLVRPDGLGYRPDRWLLAVADGGSRWGYSYQVREDGTLAHRERYFSLHRADAEDETGAGSAIYSREGHLLVATRLGIQACADDGPTQVILPSPGPGPVTGLALGGRDGDTLFAFTGSSIWRRRVRVHALTAASPWIPARASPL